MVSAYRPARPTVPPQPETANSLRSAATPIAFVSPKRHQEKIQRMSRISFALTGVLLVLSWCTTQVVGQEEETATEKRPVSETLLPSYTKAAVVIRDADDLLDKIQRTRFGQIFEKEELQPLVDELRRKLEANLTDADRKLGMSLEDIQGIRTGELTFAAFLPAEDSHAVAVLADVKGNEAKAKAMLTKVEEGLERRKAEKLEDIDIKGTAVSRYQLPLPRGKAIAERVYYAIAGGYMLVSDHEEVIRNLVLSVTGKQSDDFVSLAEVSAYEKIAERLKAAPGTEQSDFRWFVEPFGLSKSIQNAIPKGERGKNVLNILYRHGFSAIKGIGGDVTFATDTFEILHRSYVYAPPAEDVADGGYRYTLSARSLAFKNVPHEKLRPQPFILPDTATYLSYNWDMLQAFDSIGGLVDELVGGEGAFDRMLIGMREAPDGPQVDIREELIKHFENQFIMISDIQKPITLNSERVAILIPVKDNDSINEALRKAMKVEENVVVHTYKEITIWEKDPSVAEEETEEEFDLLDFNGQVQHDEQDMPEEESLAGWNSFAVANGYLFVANSREMIEEMIDNSEAEGLADQSRFKKVEEALNDAVGSNASFSQFGRMDEVFRVVFELTREGKMPESQSLLGEFLNRQLGTGEPGVLREQQIDPKSLPQDQDAYDRLIAPYIGPSGWRGITEDEGYFFFGGMIPNLDDSESAVETASPNSENGAAADQAAENKIRR